MSIKDDFGQGESKMVVRRDPERSVHQYVSTGSATKRHLQAALAEIPAVQRLT